MTLPGSVIALFFLLMLALLLGARFLVHLVVEGRVRSFRVAKGARDVLIVGGGEGGRLVVRELVRNPQLRLRPVGFVDDDPRKQGIKDEHGLKVLGTTSAEDLARILDEVEPDEVVIAIPSAPGTLRARVVTACRERGIPVRTMPTVFELLHDGSGQLKVTRQLREVRVEDMLGREPVRMELERVGAYLAGEVVMVTGAGGSIGAELCRQIARVAPRRWCSSTTPRTTCSRSCASSRRIATSAPPSRCSPTARRRSGCARCSPSTGRASSSTPPPTST